MRTTLYLLSLVLLLSCITACEKTVQRYVYGTMVDSVDKPLPNSKFLLWGIINPNGLSSKHRAGEAEVVEFTTDANGKFEQIIDVSQKYELHITAAPQKTMSGSVSYDDFLSRKSYWMKSLSRKDKDIDAGTVTAK